MTRGVSLLENNSSYDVYAHFARGRENWRPRVVGRSERSRRGLAVSLANSQLANDARRKTLCAVSVYFSFWRCALKVLVLVHAHTRQHAPVWRLAPLSCVIVWSDSASVMRARPASLHDNTIYIYNLKVHNSPPTTNPRNGYRKCSINVDCADCDWRGARIAFRILLSYFSPLSGFLSPSISVSACPSHPLPASAHDPLRNTDHAGAHIHAPSPAAPAP